MSLLINIISHSGMKVNKNGGVYTNGRSFSKEKWLEIITAYYKHRDENGKPPSQCQLSRIAKISINSSKRAIRFIKDGCVNLPLQGHGKKNVGS